MSTYVKELDRDLSSMELQLWKGEYFHPNLCKYYQDLWRAEYAARKGLPAAVQATTPVVQHTSGVMIALPIARPNVCEFLQRRTEFKAGCGGWRCLHRCEKGLPAVPGAYCQTCSQYEDSGRKFQ